MEHEKSPPPAAPPRPQGKRASSIELQIASLDRTEREQLEKEFREVGAAMSEGLESASRKDGGMGGPAEDSVSKDMTLGFWGKLILFIQQIFTGVTEEEYLKKRAINRLASRIRSYKPALYNDRTNQLLPAFAESVYKLSSVMLALRQICESCHHTSPDAGSKGFIEFFLRQLEPELPNLETRYSYEYIKDNPRLFEKDQAKQTIDRDLDQMIALIDPYKRRMITETYNNFIAYQRLAFFNFFAFLRRFGDNTARKPDGVIRANPIDVNEALFDLTRLEEIIYGIDLFFNMDEIFSALSAYAERYTADHPEKKKEVTDGGEGGAEANAAARDRSWKCGVDARFIPALTALIKGGRLSNIIRIASRTPERKPSLRRITTNPIEEMRAAQRAHLISYVEVVQHKIHVDELDKRVSELFGDTKIPDIEFYNEETNKKLQAMDLPIFLYCRQVQMAKAFQIRMFEPLVRPALNSIVVDGEFLDRNLHTNLGDYFYKFNELYSQIQEFERKVSKNSQEGEKTQSLILRFSGDPPTFKVVSDKVHFLNNLAAKALRGLGELVLSAIPPLDALVRDVTGSRKPEFVRNIRQIGGNRNKLVGKAIQRVLEVTTSLAGILEPFVKDK
jgi:hypothetical protein